MNQFETRINALRLQYKAERMEIQKAGERHVGHLNTAIGQTTMAEAKEALRAEKARVQEAARQSIAWSRMHYRQQLSALNDEYRLHLTATPSRRAMRRAAAV